MRRGKVSFQETKKFDLMLEICNQTAALVERSCTLIFKIVK